MKTKRSYNLPEEEVAHLEDQARQENTTVTAILRRALRRDRILTEKLAGGGQLLIRTGRRTQEVFFV